MNHSHLNPVLLTLICVLSGCAASGGPRATDGGAAPAGRNQQPMQRVAASTAPGDIYDLLVAELAGRRGQMEVAVEKYLAVARRTRDLKVAERAAQVTWFSQSMPQALAAAELWVEMAPQSPAAQRHAALVNFRAGQAMASVPYFERYIALTATQTDQGFMSVANQLAGEQDEASALVVMDALVKGKAGDLPPLLAKAQFDLRKSRFKEALESTARALALDPHSKEAVVLHARALANGESKEAALTYLESVLKTPLGNEIDIRMGYARLLLDLDRLEDARAQFDYVTGREPFNPEAHYAAGLLALQGRDMEAAERYLKRSLELGHRAVECNYYLGQLAELKGSPEDAIAYYSEVDEGEFYFEAQVRVAALLAELGQLNSAREYLHQIGVENTQQDLQLYLLEGELLRRAGLYQEAGEFYDAALEALPDSHELLYARALNAERLDDLAKAESDLQRIISADPDNAQALNALGYTLADRTQRYDEALGYIRRALELQPDAPEILDSMGWVQYRLGNYPEALNYLRRAVETMPDAEIAAHLGEVLWVSGDQGAARVVWEEALKKEPAHDALLRTMKQFGL